MYSRVTMIAIVIVILIVGALFAGNNRKKRKLLFLKKQFGNKPLKETFDFTQTKMYFTECDHKKEHIVDDETWNDLDIRAKLDFHRLLSKMQKCFIKVNYEA